MSEGNPGAGDVHTSAEHGGYGFKSTCATEFKPSLGYIHTEALS